MQRYLKRRNKVTVNNDPRLSQYKKSYKIKNI